MHRCFFYIKKNQVNSENHSILLEKEGWQWQVDKKKKRLPRDTLSLHGLSRVIHKTSPSKIFECLRFLFIIIYLSQIKILFFLIKLKFNWVI